MHRLTKYATDYFRLNKLILFLGNTHMLERDIGLTFWPMSRFNMLIGAGEM